MDYFVGGEITSPDALAERLEKPIAEISGALMGLELKRLVAKRADGRFEAR
jgi:DNA processing protein